MVMDGVVYERGAAMFTCWWSRQGVDEQIYNLRRFIPKLRDSPFVGWLFYGCATLVYKVGKTLRQGVSNEQSSCSLYYMVLLSLLFASENLEKLPTPNFDTFRSMNEMSVVIILKKNETNNKSTYRSPNHVIYSYFGEFNGIRK